jgi:long-chain fatty acid transport protein
MSAFMRVGPSIAAALSVLVVLAAAGAAEASPQDVLGYGARSQGLGTTGVASARGYEAVYSNPALLSLQRETEIDIGLVGAVFSLEANEPMGSDGLAAGVLGGALPIPLPGVLKDRIVLGFGFITPFDIVVRSRILYVETPQFLLPDRVESIAAQVGLGVDIGWGVRLGIGFEALAALSGTVLAAVDSSGKLGAVVQDTLVASYAPVAGVAVDVPGGWRAGLAFHGPLVGKFDVRIDIRDLGQITVPPVFVSGVAQYDPLKLEAEFARTEAPVRAALAVGWKRWSAYPGLAEATVRCPLDVETFELPQCAAPLPEEPEFNDTVVVRAGTEFVYPARPGIELLARVGYFFESAPAPEQVREANVYEEARSQITFGFGLDVGQPIADGVKMDFFGQLGVLHGRTHEKGEDVTADNPGRPSVETGGYMLAGGTSLGVAF